MDKDYISITDGAVVSTEVGVKSNSQVLDFEKNCERLCAYGSELGGPSMER